MRPPKGKARMHLCSSAACAACGLASLALSCCPQDAAALRNAAALRKALGTDAQDHAHAHAHAHGGDEHAAAHAHEEAHSEAHSHVCVALCDSDADPPLLCGADACDAASGAVGCAPSVCAAVCAAPGPSVDDGVDYLCWGSPRSALMTVGTALEAERLALALGCQGSHQTAAGDYAAGATQDACATATSDAGDDGDDATHVDELKWESAAIILGVGLFGGIIPAALHTKYGAYDGAMSLVNCFSGGVFVGTCLLHLLPEAVETFAALNYTRYEPLPYLLFAAGYYLVLLIERVIFFHAPSHGERSATADVEPLDSQLEPLDSQRREKADEDAARRASLDVQVSRAPALMPVRAPSFHDGVPLAQMRSSLVLVLAISVHSLFGGLALGLASSLESVRQLLVAISAHKWAAALAIGTRILRAGASVKQALLVVAVFSLVTPIGIIIGTAAQSDDPWANLVLNCLAAGTFLYVGTTEVVGEELDSPHKDDTHSRGGDTRGRRMLKFLAMLVGVAVVALAALINHE